MQTFYKPKEIAGSLDAEGRLYREFLRVPAMSCGVYQLPAGSDDPQKPHAEDEMYYVISGAASMVVQGDDGMEDHEVGPGDVVYVRAGREHRFHHITKELLVLVMFAPAENV